MAAPDMEVIKEIPGYKVILKAILKSQIQQLVEQLACHTDEESVLLTASVSDGTLCHLGSDSGKFFLEDHEDIKSQFLGFCLKRHHKKKQDKEREEAAQSMATSPGYGSGRPGFAQRTPRYMNPRHAGVRGMGSHPRPRHSPYPLVRPPRRPPAPGYDSQTGSPIMSPSTVVNRGDAQTLRMDTDSLNRRDTQTLRMDTDSQNSLDAGANESNSCADKPLGDSLTPAQIKKEATNQSENEVPSAQDPGSEQSFSNTGPLDGLGLDSDLSNLISGDQTTPSQTVSETAQASTSSVEGTDTSVNVKLEAGDGDDEELEITGVEPGEYAGQMGSQDNSWAQNVDAAGLGYDPLGGAGSQGDMSGTESGFTMFWDGCVAGGNGQAWNPRSSGHDQLPMDEHKLRHREMSKLRMRRYRERLKQRRAQIMGNILDSS